VFLYSSLGEKKALVGKKKRKAQKDHSLLAVGRPKKETRFSFVYLGPLKHLRKKKGEDELD